MKPGYRAEDSGEALQFVWVGKAPLGLQHHGLFRTVGIGGGASGWRPGLAVGI